mgnify:CR=1 FL=1
MEKQDVQNVLSLLKAAYPNSFKGKTGVSHRVPWKQGLLACAKWFF